MTPTITWYLGHVNWCVNQPSSECWFGEEHDDGSANESLLTDAHMREELFSATGGCRLLLPMLPCRDTLALVSLPGPLVTVGMVLTAVHSFYNEQPMDKEGIALVQAAADRDCWFNKDRVLEAQAAGKPVYWADVMCARTCFDCLRVGTFDKYEVVLTR